MRSKKRKIVILSFIFIIIILLIIAFSTSIINIQDINENIRRGLYGEPIDLETGMINNSYFEINSNGENAKETTIGINQAIEYANKYNVEYIRLEKGTYLIESSLTQDNYAGIVLKSNIILDLNGSTLKYMPDGRATYSIILLNEIENVKIINGFIIGDRYEHNYNNGSSTHEWGMGIKILGATNVELSNLQISNTTGDGIYIGEGTNGKTDNILICNNNIYNCRRQGITVITASNLKIDSNEIYNINGTPPSTGIDLERNNDKQTYENIVISNNKLYGFDNDKNIAICAFDGITNLDIFGNEIEGIIYINKPNPTINEHDNKFI